VRTKIIVVTKVCTLAESFSISNLVKHGNNLQMWDFHSEIESPEKAGFLYYQDAPTLTLARKRERDYVMLKAKIT
jgi:hypothetical protein